MDGYQFFGREDGSSIVGGRDNRRQLVQAPIPAIILEPNLDIDIDLGAWSAFGVSNFFQGIRKGVLEANPPAINSHITGNHLSAEWNDQGQYIFTLSPLPTKVNKVKTMQAFIYANSSDTLIQVRLFSVTNAFFNHTFNTTAGISSWQRSTVQSVNLSRANFNLNQMELVPVAADANTQVLALYFRLTCE